MRPIPLVAMLAIAIGGGIVVETGIMAQQTKGALSQLSVEGRLPGFDGAEGWLNTAPLTPADLRGKVVLVEFWTYSCINWLRVQPYVRAWAEKYKDAGLVVVGVHTPEFGFEKDVDNIRWAVGNYRVNYPIAIDSNYGVWRAFDNHYWPALYFIDGEGRIRHHQFGEGDYERSEAVIQELLAEAGRSGFERQPVSTEASGIGAAADWESLGSPETYVGSARAENFVSRGGALTGGPGHYDAPERLQVNEWALAGSWDIGSESAVVKTRQGRLAFRFHARDLNLVMGPALPGASVRFRVRIDGQAPATDSGLDVDKDGNGSVAEQRLYQLIRQKQPIIDRTFEIEFLDPGAELFVFTFG